MRLIKMLNAAACRMSLRRPVGGADDESGNAIAAKARRSSLADAAALRTPRALLRIIGLGISVTAFGAMASPSDTAPIAQYMPLSTSLIVTPASTNIPCSNSPFGGAVPVVQDYEAMLMLGGEEGYTIDEYRPSTGAEPQPLQRVYRASKPSAGANTAVVSVDLNGNGKEAVVELGAFLTSVRVYDRTTGPTATLISSWTFGEQIDQSSLSIVAGDLDGSNDRQQEIAFSWKVAGISPDAGKIRVMVLQGTASGQLAQGNGVTAASFLTSAVGLQYPRLAVGDFLAQGRDQLVLAGYNPATARLSLDLLQFDNGSNPSTITTALPALGNSMRGMHFDSPRIDVQQAGTNRFYYDDQTYNIINYSAGAPSILDFRINGGDVVDTAAAELALHFSFEDLVAQQRIVAMRLMHFNTTRSPANTIMAITLGNAFAFSQADSSIKLASYPRRPSSGPRFDAKVADVDSIARKELVTALIGENPGNSADFGSLAWSAHKVYVRPVALFAWQNLGIDTQSKRVVEFTDVSHGDIASYQWDFGDGSPLATQKNPRHAYASNGNYTITLYVTDQHGQQVFSIGSIAVTGTYQATPSYLAGNYPWSYAIEPLSAFSYTSTTFNVYDLLNSFRTSLKLAVGDMGRDGLAEVLVAANNKSVAIDTHVFRRLANGGFGLSSMRENVSGVTELGLVLSDFDGDALQAILSTVLGDCRDLVDTSVTSLTWMPPYFRVPQANATRLSHYGKSNSTSTSSLETTQSFFANSFTAALGVTAEVSTPVLGIKIAEVTAKAKLGAAWQTVNGETHGTEIAYSVDQGFSIGNNSTRDQEGLLITQQNASKCYSYDIKSFAGIVPGSMLRSCEANPSQQFDGGSGAAEWNMFGTVAVPVHWVPMQRDWANLALFRVPVARSGTGALIAFNGAESADKVTDGLFVSSAMSFPPTAPINKPYLELDLGEVREIHSIRVFPRADNSGIISPSQPLAFRTSAASLQGFRLYASQTPFASHDLPSAASANTIVPGGVSTFVQDAVVEASYRSWNAWTVGSAGPTRARYIRLQKPTDGIIAIAQIQVFGDTHSEPQFYPEAVCDAVKGDGVFLAHVYDKVSQQYRNIQVRGDMEWTGAVDIISSVVQPTGVPGCVNDTVRGIRQGPIWQGLAVSGNVDSSWNFNSDTTQTNSTARSDEWSVHAGAEFEAKLGAGVLLVVGAEFEHTSGASTENQTGNAFTKGFQLGGEVGGFAPTHATACRYFPRPYNFVVSEYSNAGFLQKMNVTDYVIRQKLYAASNAWQREAVPALCSDPFANDRIFTHGFDN